MSIPSDFRSDVNASGTWRFTGTVTLPDDTITSAMVSDATEFAHSVVEHRFPIHYSQKNGTDVVTETMMIHMAYKGETVLAGYAFVDEPPSTGTSDKTVVIDVKKSTAAGAFATILSSTLTINASSAEKTALSLSLSGTPTLIAGDVLEVSVTAAGSSGTQAQGLVVVLFVMEDPA